MSEYELIQAAAITEADNRTREADLPTYSQLVEALREMSETFDAGTCFSELVAARLMLARIPRERA